MTIDTESAGLTPIETPFTEIDDPFAAGGSAVLVRGEPDPADGGRAL